MSDHARPVAARCPHGHASPTESSYSAAPFLVSITPLFTAERLPRRPYCSDDKTAKWIRPLKHALTHRYIQPNPPGMLNWMLFDIDHPHAMMVGDGYDWRILPPPNIVVGNPENGHAHYYYCLEAPVCLTEKGRNGPQRYARAVYDALGVLLGTDPGYTGLIAKNPLHPAHSTIWLRNAPYSLGELADYLDLDTGRTWRAARGRASRTESNVLRNCSIFDDLRRWAYSGVGEYRQAGNEDAWRSACLRQAEALNSFPGHPNGDLPLSEVRCIATSVAKWTWRHYHGTRGSDPEFSATQAARGRQKGARRRSGLLPLVQAMAAAGKTQREIATEFGIDQKTVSNWLRRPTGK